MPKYKTIRIKKPNGETRLQRVQVLASGKYKFVKNVGRLVKSYKPRGSGTKRAMKRYDTKYGRKSTRKYQVRKTARRAYTGLKRKVRRKTNKDSMWNW